MLMLASAVSDVVSASEVGHIHGVSPLAVVVTPGSFMGQESLGRLVGFARLGFDSSGLTRCS